MAQIYKITNMINNKIYIGETVRNVDVRWREHKNEALNEGHGYNYPIHMAMRKYGFNNFKIEILENCADEIRFERESYYIKLYSSHLRTKGYNITLEGSGVILYSSEDIKSAWDEGLSINEIAIRLGCHKSVVSKRLRGLSVSEEEIKNRISLNSSMRQGQPIYQYSLNGELIKQWASASECARQTGYEQTAISNVCRQEQYSAYGYLWKLVNDNRPISEWVINNSNKQHSGRPKKRIAQYNKDTFELIQIYESAAAAARNLGLSDKSNICAAARKNGNAAGYKWKYIEGE